MKIPINLASQPFRRDRAMLMASVAVSLLLVATLGVLISLAMADRSQLADVRHDVSRITAQIKKVASEQARLDAVLRRPENAEVLERSVFLNALITRKSISWTRIFADLERVLPYNVRILQIRPQLAANHVLLDMNVGSESPMAMIEFLRALEVSPSFGAPLEQNKLAPTQAEPLYRYHLVVTYEQKL